MQLAPSVETLTCSRCGSDWNRALVRGAKPHLCPECKKTPIPQQRASRAVRRGNARTSGMESTPGYRLALAVTSYRLIIEEAASALRLGRAADALAALERAAAPARSMEIARNNRRSPAA